MMETTPRVIGLSRDNRTQRWLVTCPRCGHVFEPQTTRLSWQDMDCPKTKCGARMMADYNAEPPTVKLVRKEAA
jgi:phage terminase large subunit GpA-like protein